MQDHKIEPKQPIRYTVGQPGQSAGTTGGSVAPLNYIRSIRDISITNKRVFMRLDFNVPLSEPDENGIRKVEDDSRIREALPTIQYAIEQGARLIIASHLGRPEGQVNPEFSLLPVAAHLAGLLNSQLKTEIMLADGCVGEGIEMMAQNLKPGQVLMLENLRFHKGEEENDPIFVRSLVALTDIYINDAFGTAHRKHASTYGVPAAVQTRGMGFLIEKELKFLDPLLNKPASPFYAVLGGSKVSDKIKTIESLIRKVDGLLIGGAMAHAFWAAQGDSIPAGAKQPKPADVEAAKAIFEAARRQEIPVIVPSDTNAGFDIGPKTIERFCEILSHARTVFWNGPLGWFERPEYSRGTFEVARALSQTTALKVVGGGDTVSAIKHAGAAERYDHLSTGGGAVLEYLEGNGLPGIDVLKTYRIKAESPVLN